MTLRELLAGLPPDALVPAGWVLDRLPAEASDAIAPLAGDLSVADVGRQLGRSPSTVRAWCEQGRFPGAYKLPGDPKHAAWRIPASALGAFVASRRAATIVLPSPAIDAAPVVRVAPRRASASGAPDLGAWRHDRKAAP